MDTNLHESVLLKTPLLVYGVGGEHQRIGASSIDRVVDEGKTCLVHANLGGEAFTIRVLKSNPDVGIMITGHKE